jgi:predicted enzyme related to lactoylglutathione lyase
LLGIASIPAAQAAPNPSVVLPSLTQPPSGEHHVGKVVWSDLVTPDLDVAKHFYAGLFGWTFRDVPGDPNYQLALLNGMPLAGLYRKPLTGGQSQQPHWLTFLAVQDVDATQRTVVRHGGKVISAPHDYQQRGRQAVLADPDGAVFAVLAAPAGDPPDYTAEPGERIWASLMVKNAGRETEFYQSVFGYEVYDLAGEGESGGQHYVLAGDSYARLGLNALPADSMRRRPHWLNFIRVADAADASRKTVVLGGRVLVEPRMDRHGGRLAILADPSGAPFGVMEWSDSDTNQEPQ